MSRTLTETVVKDAALGWLESLGYSVLHGPDIAASELWVKDVKRIAGDTA